MINWALFLKNTPIGCKQPIHSQTLLEKIVIRFFYNPILGWCIFIILIAAVGVPVKAIGLDSWLLANHIPLYDDEYPPYLVADQNRIVHAFNSQQMENGEVAILYRTWSVEMGWSSPVDILLPDTNLRLSLQGAFLDEAGVFHIVYYRGNQGSGEFLYSRALASEAMNAHSWPPPINIADLAGPLNSAALTGDGKGKLTLVYAGQKLGIGLYEVHSNDGGISWTDSVAVAVVFEPDNLPTHIRVTGDSLGRLHVVWSTVSSRGLGEKVYYSRREEDGVSWNKPYELAAREGQDYAADWASIIYYNDELIVMYMDGSVPSGVPPTRWMRRSGDGGQSWTSPFIPFSQVGEHGFAELIVDSNNALHIVLANRVGFPVVEGLWYGRWLGNRWGELELVTPSSPEQAIAIGSYPEVGRASRPNAIISQGNVLLVTWWHDLGVAGLTVPASYSFTFLDAPELPLIPLPRMSESLTPEVEIISEQPPFSDEFEEALPAAPSIEKSVMELPLPITINPLELMIQGTIPAILMIFTFIYIYSKSLRKH